MCGIMKVDPSHNRQIMLTMKLDIPRIGSILRKLFLNEYRYQEEPSTPLKPSVRNPS